MVAAATPDTERNEQLVLVLTAAVDADCDGELADEKSGAPGFRSSQTLLPGQCIVYRTDYRNDGDFPLHKVVVRTPLPDRLVYVPGTAEHVLTPPGLWPRALHIPAEGDSGGLIWRFSGGLAPGEAGRVEFRVRLEP